MIINTSRLIIRDFKIEYWTAVHQYASQANILIYEPWGPNSEEQTKSFVSQAIKNALETPRLSYEFAITLASNGKLIGGCGIKINHKNPEKANLGYIINPDFWNQGYAIKAATGLISTFQKRTDLKSLTAICDEFNLASQKVLEKCDFIKTQEKFSDLKFKGRKGKTYYYELKI